MSWMTKEEMLKNQVLNQNALFFDPLSKKPVFEKVSGVPSLR